MTAQAFIKLTLPLAAEAAVKYGINPVGAMAQSALETGWGKSAPGNMYFGMKPPTGWKGKTQTLTTKEVVNGETVTVQSVFCAYDTPLESFLHYGERISSLPRYKTALQYPAYGQTDEYLRAIAAGGYATATNYAASVISCANTIKKYITDEQVAAAVSSASKRRIAPFAVLGLAVLFAGGMLAANGGL